MKRVTFISIVVTILFGSSNLFARTILVKISNIRNDKGNVLVMAQVGKDIQPIYGKAEAKNGEVTIKLENVDWEQFDISVFHDENNNIQMDMTEDKRPAEGYAMKSCKPQQEEETVKLKLYYPVNE